MRWEKESGLRQRKSSFDRGVRSACNASINYKVGSAYVIQVAERIEEDMHSMKWRTVIEVAKKKILPDDATVSQAESAQLRWRQQEPFAAWLEQDVFALTFFPKAIRISTMHVLRMHVTETEETQELRIALYFVFLLSHFYNKLKTYH